MDNAPIRELRPWELEAMLPQLLERQVPISMLIRGSSMAPFLVNGRDLVLLKKIEKPLRPGDMILYRRDSGAWVLHRIYRMQGDTMVLLGDAQTVLEPGIRREQAAAVAIAVRRKGKLLGPGSFWWMFFRGPWRLMRPIRPILGKLYPLLTPWNHSKGGAQ